MPRFAVLLVAFALAGCGARTGLGLPLDIDGPGDAGTDAPLTPDVGPDAPIVLDAGTDAPPDVFVPEDAFVPECPDPVTVRGREASIPVDIIWVIDNSGSMLDDIERMRDNVGRFWDALTGARLDVQVVYVTQGGSAPEAPGSLTGRHNTIDDRVNSWDPLLKLLTHYETYQRWLRADARTHFVVVTDDDSRALPWMDFHEEMLELLGHEYFFHSIASERVMPTEENPTGACFTPTSSASRPGREYYALSDETGGLKLSICNEDWSELFDALTERIAIRVPIRCAYSLPIPPPAGMLEYEPDDFLISYRRPGDETRVYLPRQPSEEACGDGWWYFEGSDRVVLCPETCEEIEALEGEVDIDVGCNVDID